MKRSLFLCLSALFLFACKNEKKTEDGEAAFFPVLSFIRGQVKTIDTSLYRIVKIETVDTVSRSTYIRREDFKTYAQPFLELPDIASDKWKDDYEETKMFDDAMNKVILTYTAKDNENEVRRQDVMLNPTNADGNSEVQTIIINTESDKGDSTMLTTMVWYVNKRFTVVSRVQKPNVPEKVRKLEVIWNDFTDQTSL